MKCNFKNLIKKGSVKKKPHCDYETSLLNNKKKF